MDIKHRQLEIIEAAGKLLTRYGISGLTIKNLAAEMSFSESAIYRHFSGKEEIIITLLQYLNKDIAQILEEVPTTDDYENDFVYFFRHLAHYFKDNPHYVVAVFSEGLMDKSETINSSIMQLMNTLTELVQQMVEKGQESRIITKLLTSNQITQIITPTLKHQIFKWKLSNFETDIVKNIDSLSKSLLKLLKLRT